MSDREILKETNKILLDIVTFIYRAYKNFLNPEERVLLESLIIRLGKIINDININENQNEKKN